MARRKEPAQSDPPAKRSGKPAPAKPARAFDVWLDRGLHSMFDSIAAEPIPEELLRLLEEDQSK